MSVNTALFVVSALLCLHAVRSLPRSETLDGDCLVFWQASAYRPTTKSVIDENGHAVGKLFANQGRDLWQDSVFTVVMYVKKSRLEAGQVSLLKRGQRQVVVALIGRTAKR